MIIDTHCHLQFLSAEQKTQVLQEARERDFGFINVATAPENFARVIGQALAQENIWAALGVHPTEAAKLPASQSALGILETYLQKQDLQTKLVAVGEIGLDYFHLKSEGEKAIQQELFKAQLKLAQKYNKPVIVHSRNSYRDVLRILQEVQADNFVLHFFEGSLELLDEFLKLGGLVSFSYVITFTEDYDNLVKVVPADKFLLETDAPFVRENNPLDIKEVYLRAASLRNISLAELTTQLEENARRFFSL